MDIFNATKYSNNCYNDLLYEFEKFKQYIIHELNCLEHFIQNFIKENCEQFTFSHEVFQFVEKDLQINSLINSLRESFNISNNCLNSTLLNKNYLVESLFEQTQTIYQQLKQEFQEKLRELIHLYCFSLESEDRHPDIEFVDKQTIKRSACSAGRWLIQCFQGKYVPFTAEIYTIKFQIEGSSIMFGIAPLKQIKKENLELSKSIEDIYFIRQDGIHFGFGISQKQQEKSIPDFSAKKNDIVSMSLNLLQKKILLQNLTAQTQAEYQIPKISEDWCFIIGLRFPNECIKLMK